jgi:hypothetical protein
MPFSVIPSKAWKDSLGPQVLTTMSENLRYLRRASAREHRWSNGQHNAFEVPRIVGRIVSNAWTGSYPSEFTFSHHGTGQYRFVFAAGGNVALSVGSLDPSLLRVQLNNLRENPVPYLATYTTYFSAGLLYLDVFVRRLTSTLGVAGNAWALIDGDVDVAIHCPPVPDAITYAALPQAFTRGVSLPAVASNAADWATQVQEAGEIQRILSAEHVSTTGEHNVLEVAKASGLVTWNGTAYSTTSSTITGITRVSAGSLQLTHATWVTPTGAFVSPDYARTNGGSPTAPIIVNARQQTTGIMNVYIYAWDQVNLWWQMADADFFIAMHGG